MRGNVVAPNYQMHSVTLCMKTQGQKAHWERLFKGCSVVVLKVVVISIVGQPSYNLIVCMEALLADHTMYLGRIFYASEGLSGTF